MKLNGVGRRMENTPPKVHIEFNLMERSGKSNWARFGGSKQSWSVASFLGLCCTERILTANNLLKCRWTDVSDWNFVEANWRRHTFAEIARSLRKCGKLSNSGSIFQAFTRLTQQVLFTIFGGNAKGMWTKTRDRFWWHPNILLVEHMERKK